MYRCTTCNSSFLAPVYRCKCKSKEMITCSPTCWKEGLSKHKSICSYLKSFKTPTVATSVHTEKFGNQLLPSAASSSSSEYLFCGKSPQMVQQINQPALPHGQGEGAVSVNTPLDLPTLPPPHPALHPMKSLDKNTEDRLFTGSQGRQINVEEVSAEKNDQILGGNQTSANLVTQLESQSCDSFQSISRNNVKNPISFSTNTVASSPPLTSTVLSSSGTSTGVTATASGQTGDRCRPLWTQLGRDKFGRFKRASQGLKVRDDDQKKRDKVHSSVSKWKQAIVVNMKKIQAVKPDVSQTYLVHSDVKSTLKNPVVYKTVGKTQIQHENLSVSVDGGVNLDDEELVDLPPAPAQALAMRSETNRLADKLCFVCKKKVGPVHSKRIVCRKSNCSRGAAHLKCLNLRSSSVQALLTIRNSYLCPRHDQELDISEDDAEGFREEVGEVSKKRSDRTGTSKNSNLFLPLKLSASFMEVMGTQQTYQKINQIRQLTNSYIKENKLEKRNGLVVPDARLATITGATPFSLKKIVTVLKAGKHITKP